MQETFSEELLEATSLDQRLQWLRKEVERIGPPALRGVEKTGPFSATVLVAKDDEVLLEKAIGLASRRHAVPNNREVSE